MSETGWYFLLTAVSILATLFYSVTAVALRIYSVSRLHEAFKQRGREESAAALAEDSEQLALTCALYRVVFNAVILLCVLAILRKVDGRVPEVLHYLAAFAIGLVIFSIFSVAVPHAWAKYSGEKILSGTFFWLRVSLVVAQPVLYVFRLWDRFIKRLAGVPEFTAEERQEERQEEFLSGLEQRRMEGVVDEEEQEMIENVLELNETTADQIMTPRTEIVALEANSDREMVIKTINEAGHTRVPVYEENIDNILGFVYAKDLLTEIGRQGKDFSLRSKMRQAYFVPESKPLRTLLHEFQNQKLHIAVVLDEYGGTAGIVTLEDILEELVGEIADEYEEAEPEAVRNVTPGVYEVDARTYVDDLNDKLDLNLPEEEDYDTIGGFVFSHLGYIPKTGESFDYGDVRFTISSAETRKIKRIKIEIKSAESGKAS